MYFSNLVSSFLVTQLISFAHSQNPDDQQELAAFQTQAIARIFSFIQCLPKANTTANLDSASQQLIQIHQKFNPEDHLSEYSNATEVRELLDYVNQLNCNGTPYNLPFQQDAPSIYNFQLTLKVLYHNTDNWPLFYNTSVWLIHRVNTAHLFWALNVIAPQKFSDTMTVPSAVEIFPQLYIPKEWTYAAASDQLSKFISDNLLYYWTTDPGLNEFHTHFHMDNSVWWNDRVYGTHLHRRGELFFYMHHNIVNRYNAELLCHDLPEVEPLVFQPDYPIPFGYQSDIVNVDFEEFPSRPDGELIGQFNATNMNLTLLQTIFDRLWQGIENGYLLAPDGNHISIKDFNGINLLGDTQEAARAYSANINYYGTLHNSIHQLLRSPTINSSVPYNNVPGVQGHQETSMRDRAFYQIHKKVDTLFTKYKELISEPYTKEELEFPGISISKFEIVNGPRLNQQELDLRLNSGGSSDSGNQPIILTTFMRNHTFDITTVARPCRTVSDPPILAHVQTLNYQPFNYILYVQSRRPQLAYGMVRIFLWPEFMQNGTKLEGDEAHIRAIELDRFRVRLDPLKLTVINRSSLDSSFTRVEPSPGIKSLYNVKPGSNLLTNPAIRRACAFPNNLLIPKGNKTGVPFILTVYISDETDVGEVEEYPHYPMCGALKGLPFPDKRPMGFPFERPGTNFSVKGLTLGATSASGSSPVMANIRQVRIFIKHNG